MTAAGRSASPPAEAPSAPPGGGREGTAGTFRSTQVNLGHIFALRPRPNTSFRPDELRAARQLLQEERYGSIEEAARAVAEKALERNREEASRGFKPRR